MNSIGKMYRTVGNLGAVPGQFSSLLNMRNICIIPKGTVFTLISVHEEGQIGYGKEGYITILIGDRFFWTNQEVLGTSAKEIRTRKKC